MSDVQRITASAALLLALGCATGAEVRERPAPPIEWTEWSPTVFARARAEGRLVLLDLGAVWCHWCHVMERETYGDSAVRAIVDEGYVAVQVDQDERPDLASRYEEYGWPATILFDADGVELAKFRGFIPPRDMAARLTAFRADPTRGPSAPPVAEIRFESDATLSAERRTALEERRLAGYDDEHGGWGRIQKFLDPGNVELALSRRADARETRMARETLDRALTLIDPVWGGVYQYSHGGVWSNPHFEKIMAVQASYLRIYSLAYARFGESRYLDAARSIERYLATFLSDPEGAFYASQDADVVRGEHAGEYFALPDGERRRLGVPAVDEHRYARESGWAADALCALHAATGDRAPLDRAVRAARWVIANRSFESGGFRHDAFDRSGPYLADTLAMGRAFSSLYAATGEPEWIARASRAARFIDETFRVAGAPGFVTSSSAGELGPFAPVHQYDENVALARWLNLLSHYTGEAWQKEMATSAMAWLSTEEVAARRRILTGSLLLADLELRSQPLHVTVVGPGDDALAAGLFAAALRIPFVYKRVEWYDPARGPLPHHDIDFPALTRAAAFLCANGACSAPIHEPGRLAEAAARSR